MSARFTFSVSLPLLLVALALAPATARGDVFSDAANLFRDTEAASPFFSKSYGYAIFPTIGKGGFILAGGYGRGRVFVAGDPVGDTTVTQASLGLQIGGQAYTQIIFFEDERAFREFSAGGFEFGGQANAMVLRGNVQGTISTAGSTAGTNEGINDVESVSPGYWKGMAVFIIGTGGLMLEASVGGQRFSYRPIAQGLENQNLEVVSQ